MLHGVDLDVERGEMVAVVGSSGSGKKSTLLHLLGLLDTPDSGEVFVDDNRIDNVAEATRDQHRNGTFGFIFQFYHLLPELSALENVLMPQLIRHGLWSRPGRERTFEARGKRPAGSGSGSGTVSHRLPSEPSGGEMQRAAIAQCTGGFAQGFAGRRADRQPRCCQWPGGARTSKRDLNREAAGSL